MKRISKTIISGEQTLMDYFSYSSLREELDYMEIDGQYVRCLYISGYPFIASSGWLDNLINFNYDSDISFHISEVSSSIALPKLNRKITELESTKRAMLREGKLVGSEIRDPLDSAISLRDKILRGQEKLFQFSIYVALRASSLKDLDRMTAIIESTLLSRLFFIKTARYQQIEALQSILPRATDRLNHKRNLDSTSSALSFPFVSSEIVHKNGIFYGINKTNDSLVIIDRFSLYNANSIVFAQSGSGKSYMTKIEILRQLISGTSVIVIDPEREYKNLANSVNATYIKLSANSNHHINPFDNLLNNDKSSNKSQLIQDLIGVITLMVDGISGREKALLDKLLTKIYITDNEDKEPTIKDLYNLLISRGETKFALRFEKYITGSLSKVFSAKTNIELDNRLIIFDIKDLPETLRPIMMLIIANFVSNKVKRDPIKRLLVIDEAWMLLEHEESAKFISSLVRRGRKYYLGVSIISQQANDFLNNQYGRAIASQSSFRILMRQDTTTIKEVVSEFNLSEYESSFLLTCGRGECLMIVDQSHVALKITASEEEHPLITTNPREIYK